MIRVFLSASVPLPYRDPRYMDTADVIAIREAIKGLVSVVIPKGVIVYGGHPAVTPLIAKLLRGMGAEARRRVILYQSAYFTERFPQENDEFLEYRIVPAVSDSQDESLRRMRHHMIGDTAFEAAAFIGGMEGIVDEFRLFSEYHPAAKIWPIASTGAASLDIYGMLDRPRPELFLREMTYQTLFRTLTREIG